MTKVTLRIAVLCTAVLGVACGGRGAGTNDNNQNNQNNSNDNSLCGNGAIDPSEECDGTNFAGHTCETLGLGTGSLSCTSACLVDSSGCSPQPVCGDGNQDTGEVCDDGNTTDGDGCSGNCLSDETCGNGYIDTPLGEECDDMNASQWDGCDLSCHCVEWLVNTVTTNRQTMARVAAAADGSFLVVYGSLELDGDLGGVFFQRYDAQAQPVGAETQVNTHWADAQGNLRVAMAPDGRFVVVWNSDNQDGDGRGVYGQRFDASGAPQGTEFLIPQTTAGTQEQPAVAMAPDGRFVVAWPSPDGAGLGIFARRYDSAGLPVGGEFQVSTDTTHHQASPHLSLAPDGRFFVTWVSVDQDGDGYGVYGRRYDAAGLPEGGELAINTFTAGDQWRHSMSMTADGTTFVAWTSDGQSGGLGWDTYGRRYDPAGNPLGPEFQISTTATPGANALVWVDLTDGGRAVVTWATDGADGSGLGVAYRPFAPDGTPQGQPVLVNSYVSDDQTNPSVVIRPDGSFVIAWQSVGQDGDEHGVFARMYNVTGSPLCPGP